MLNGCKEILPAGPGSENSPLDEVKKGGGSSEAILTDIS